MAVIQPFYIRTEGLSDKEIGEALDKCRKAGAWPCELVYGYHAITKLSSFVNPADYKYFGVDYDNDTVFYNDHGDYGSDAIKLTLYQLDEHLGITSEKETSQPIPEFEVGERVWFVDGYPGTVCVEVKCAEGQDCYIKESNGDISLSLSIDLKRYQKRVSVETENHTITFSLFGNKLTDKELSVDYCIARAKANLIDNNINEEIVSIFAELVDKE